MPEIKRIFGRAGTGKTYALIEEFENLINNGIHPQNIAMVTHTRTGASVFKERAINKFNLKKQDLLYFGTMHSLSWKLQGLTAKNILTDADMETFNDLWYPTNPHADSYLDHYRITPMDRLRLRNASRTDAMLQIDNTLSACAISDFDFLEMESLTGRELDYEDYYMMTPAASRRSDGKFSLKWHKQHRTITPSEQIKFSKRLRQYLIDNDRYTHARNLERMCDSALTLPCEYLLFDEFQDFGLLQYKIFQNWINAPHVRYVVVAGDDAQTIFRFSSASPRFFLDLPGRHVHLPVTYRHDRVILENAQEMIDHMGTVERFEIRPAEGLSDGEVIKTYGDGWLGVVSFNNPNESVLILTSTRAFAYRIHYDLADAFPKVPFVNLEDTRLVERVFGMYNTIASLERGEEVPGENTTTGERWTDVKSLFFGNTRTSIPKGMLYLHPQMRLSAVERHPEMTNVLRHGIKKEIRTSNFKFRDFYDKDLFEKDFLTVPWVGKYLLNAIPDIEIIENANEMFPDYALPKAKKRIGTIHKAKGDEADTVILFMGISYPAYRGISKPDVRDDILRQFYIGKTRPRTKLVEVYDYLKYPDGMYAPSVLEVVP